MRFVAAKLFRFHFVQLFGSPQPTVRLPAHLPLRTTPFPSCITYRKSFRDTGIEVELAVVCSQRCLLAMLLLLPVVWLYLF